jgi:hypothetical protein
MLLLEPSRATLNLNLHRPQRIKTKTFNKHSGKWRSQPAALLRVTGTAQTVSERDLRLLELFHGMVNWHGSHPC